MFLYTESEDGQSPREQSKQGCQGPAWSGWAAHFLAPVEQILDTGPGVARLCSCAQWVASQRRRSVLAVPAAGIA